MTVTAATSIAVLTLLCSRAILAQSHPGATFDQNITTVRTRAGVTDSGTARIHVIAAGSNLKLEMSGSAPGMSSVGPEKNLVMMFSDGGAKMTILLGEQKQYVSFNPIKLIEGAQKMMAGMGATMTVDTTVTKVTVDSVGPGPDIDGHHTLHYRLVSRLRMSISAMGTTGIMDQQSQEEIDTSLDYDDLRDFGSDMNKFSELADAMGVAKAFMERVVTARQKIRGFPLRTVKQETKSTDNLTETSTSRVDVRNIKRVAIPDSAFAIPADYKPAALPMFPGAAADTANSR